MFNATLASFFLEYNEELVEQNKPEMFSIPNEPEYSVFLNILFNENYEVEIMDKEVAILREDSQERDQMKRKYKIDEDAKD